MTTEMHWARWGDPAKAHPLSDSARGMIEMFVGAIDERPSVALEDVVVPPVGLSDELLDGLRQAVGADHVHTDDETRIRRTRGKSTPDLLKLRAGDASDAPDAVVRPVTHDEVAAVVRWCSEHRVALVPFGGGTSVVGGLAARRDGFSGVIALDLIRMKRLVNVDRESMTATLEAGLLGPEAEALLAEHGLTIGHFPQSFQYASIGGFAVTRSSGQASSGYGRFDSLVVGIKVATPIGDLDLGSAPANAAGPDLRELVMGSEGAFGVATEVTLRVRNAPAVKVYETWRFPSFLEGANAMRDLKQGGIEPTVLRLSDEMETMVNLADPSSVGAESKGGCLMVTGFEADQETVDRKRALVTAALEARGGISEGLNEAWAEGRYDGPYLRDSMLDLGILVETLETATFWSNVPNLYDSVKAALAGALGSPIVLCHISHVYENGCSLYFTVAAKEEEDGIAQWLKAKAAASDAMIATGSTITHHHAIGTDHKPWFAQEIGPVGVEILRAIKERVDPAGVLNPGILVP
ncbi:MAG TPA: FAD-binding oxidoreductase [Nocardioidaceae bacterium]|nr:FAD-binding oxidoreductase [Nocardioidaceae bacterium]